MKQTKWNDNWKFWHEKDSFALVWNIPDFAREIRLPHDAMIEEPANPNSRNQGNTGYRDGDVYTYVKHLYVSKEDANQRFILKLEGVYNNALVYVNQQPAGKSMLGYSTFYVELNPFLKFGEDNEIRIQVRAGAMTNSRWYSGAGIYRDVYLITSGPVHMLPEGVHLRTEEADEEYGVISINTKIKNHLSRYQEVRICQEILDEAGDLVARNQNRITLFEGEERGLDQRITIPNPKLWSAESPYLYTCVTRIYGEELLDEDVTTFGIRTLSLDAKRGLRVNGKEVKLRGACIHHDSGLLGAATYEDAQFRQIAKLKEAGFNAVRMSHHPMAPAMLRACDSLGMYVMDELCDMWNRCKSDYDYGLFFAEWWEKDVEDMVRKDYNHPSVIMYSVGNEIPEIGSNQGAKMCHEICKRIKSLDPTRYTLASMNGVFIAGDSIDQIVADVVAGMAARGEDVSNVNHFMSIMDNHMDEIVTHPIMSDRLEKASAATDIAGYNYMTGRYEFDGKEYPNRVIVGSETYPPEIGRNWPLVKKYPYLIGDFTWTGWDYIGEAGIGIPAYNFGEGGFGAVYPCQLAYCGDIDITGFRRPMSYYKEIVYGLRKEPYIAVQNPYHYGEHLIKTPWIYSDAISSWSYKGMEGKPVVVEVYASGTEVELFRNGVSLGRKPSGDEVRCLVEYETTYEPGELTAVVYDQEEEIASYTITTVAEETSLVVAQESTYNCNPVKANGQVDLVYVTIAMQDALGVVDTDCNEKISISVEGAKLLGFGTGNPKPMYNYNDTTTELYNGRAQAILEVTDASKAQVTVTAESGKSASILLR